MLIMVHNSKKHGPLCNVWSHKACIHPRVEITVFTVVVEILSEIWIFIIANP